MKMASGHFWEGRRMCPSNFWIRQKGCPTSGGHPMLSGVGGGLGCYKHQLGDMLISFSILSSCFKHFSQVLTTVQKTGDVCFDTIQYWVLFPLCTLAIVESVCHGAGNIVCSHCLLTTYLFWDHGYFLLLLLKIHDIQLWYHLEIPRSEWCKLIWII